LTNKEETETDWSGAINV